VITVYDHQTFHQLPVERLQAFAARAVPVCKRAAKNPQVPICVLDEIEVSLIDDEAIAKVHVDFMDVPGATDVITFDHGEILISTETAAMQGAENGNLLEREVSLYIVHGLLHLAGYGDKTPDEFSVMKNLQERILREVE
jgi:probable rRNA maturation factor